jgi:hypothetical protein
MYTLAEATILETKVNRGLPTLKLEGITSYRNGCQTICPHREEAQHHHCQPQLPRPMQKMTSGPMGVLAPRSTQTWSPDQPPINTSGNLQCTCQQSHLQTSPPNPQKSYAKFQNPRTTFENLTLCPAKYSIVRGEWGSPKDFLATTSTWIFAIFTWAPPGTTRRWQGWPIPAFWDQYNSNTIISIYNFSNIISKKYDKSILLANTIQIQFQPSNPFPIQYTSIFKYHTILQMVLWMRKYSKRNRLLTSWIPKRWKSC